MPTDYDLIVDSYQNSAKHPIKLYCEGAAFQQMLGNLHGQSALDLACGDGFYTRLIKQAGAACIVGIDLSKAMLSRAIASENGDQPTIDYRRGDVVNLGKIDDFDVVTAVYLLPYADTFARLVSMFETIGRNLKPGGTFVGITMNPHLTKADLLAYQQYGITMSTPGMLQDGVELTFSACFPDQSRFSVKTTYWSQLTYERAMVQAGLRTIKWHRIGVSSKGHHHYDEDFWQPYAAKPYSVMLTCTK